MRVLHLVHQYLPEHIGGTELYTRWLTEALSQRGHEISIFYRRSAEGKGLESRTDSAPLGYGGQQVWPAWSGILDPKRRFLATFGDQALMEAFEQVLVKTRPELVHLQHLMGLPVALVWYLQERGIPFIITLHDYWWVCANAQLFTNYSQKICDGPQAYLNCARCALARVNYPHLWPAIPGLAGLLARRNQLLWQVMQAAHKLIAPSQFVANWYAAHGVPVEKLRTIFHGLLQPVLLPRPEKRPDRPIRFAYIGGLSSQKGVHVLVEAFNGLAQGTELWIAGDETADPGYVARLRQNASPGIRFLGRLTREQVWETLTQIDIVVVPSLWYETFSFIISEAFAAKAPVIASKLGPLTERVHHEGDGLLVPPGDVAALRQALCRFLQEPALLPRLQAGIQPVQTMEAHAGEIEAVYEAVIAETFNKRDRA